MRLLSFETISVN